MVSDEASEGGEKRWGLCDLRRDLRKEVRSDLRREGQRWGWSMVLPCLGPCVQSKDNKWKPVVHTTIYKPVFYGLRTVDRCGQ